MFKTAIYSFFYDFGIQSVVTLTQRSFLSPTTAVGWTQPNLIPSLALKLYSRTCCACRLHCFCVHGYILPSAPGTISFSAHQQVEDSLSLKQGSTACCLPWLSVLYAVIVGLSAFMIFSLYIASHSFFGWGVLRCLEISQSQLSKKIQPALISICQIQFSCVINNVSYKYCSYGLGCICIEGTLIPVASNQELKCTSFFLNQLQGDMSKHWYFTTLELD